MSDDLSNIMYHIMYLYCIITLHHQHHHHHHHHHPHHHHHHHHHSSFIIHHSSFIILHHHHHHHHQTMEKQTFQPSNHAGPSTHRNPNPRLPDEWYSHESNQVTTNLLRNGCLAKAEGGLGGACFLGSFRMFGYRWICCNLC